MGWNPLKPKTPRGGASARGVVYSSSPLLASKTPLWRGHFVVALCGLCACVLVGRAVYIQIVGTDFYQLQGEKRYAHTVPLPASRGRILDRNGQTLASSVAMPSIWADPKEFQAGPEQMKALAALLKMPLSELQRRVADENSRFVWLRRHVDIALWQDVKALKIKGVAELREYQRRYPESEAAAHVVGFTDADDRGQEGIELAFHDRLLGRNGSRMVIRDRTGRTVDDLGETVDPNHGDDIQLSIDAKVQFFAYQRVREAVHQHRAQAGSVVVLDVQTGEVLALANYPSYDPSDRRNLSGGQLRNRALTDTFEPGSTMKPFIAALSIESGRVRPQTAVNSTPGSMVVGGLTIRDAHPYGTLSVAEVIQKSSNIGTVRMAMDLQPREMWEMFSQIGMGQKPQLEFPGAVTGRLRPYKTWRPIEQATMSYGYGLSASLFQLARAYSVFARDGELVPVSVVRRDAPPSGVRVFSPETSRAVRQMLQMAAMPGGTAPLAQTPGYTVGGKTGTAHKQEGRGYAGNKYRSWFVGLAPVSEPRIVVAVMVDEPSNGVYYGGAVAAPVFSQVVGQTLRLLNVPPDADVKSQIVAKVPAVEESF
ncbi:MAG: peptidoglycan D,D-transpeptidase FtsI family protein [Burkholderiaceae bacterium]|jgi:cell division protein FtsI (penicillin-binding protein 3)